MIAAFLFLSRNSRTNNNAVILLLPLVIILQDA